MHVAMRTITAITIFLGLVGTAFSFCSMKLGKFTFSLLLFIPLQYYHSSNDLVNVFVMRFRCV